MWQNLHIDREAIQDNLKNFSHLQRLFGHWSIPNTQVGLKAEGWHPWSPIWHLKVSELQRMGRHWRVFTNEASPIIIADPINIHDGHSMYAHWNASKTCISTFTLLKKFNLRFVLCVSSSTCLGFGTEI